MRGRITKLETAKETKIEREFLKRRYLLHLDKKLCNGCGVCVEVCPKEAIKRNEAVVLEGHLARKPTVDFDGDSCILCGECAVMCPLGALRMEVDGEEISIVAKNEAFPFLSKEISVTNERCQPDCQLICQKECPTEAIEVLAEKTDDEISRIIDVRIDKSLCLYCKHCEYVCPHGAIEVKKPFLGIVELNDDLCPQGCRACEEICPTHAILVNDKPIVSTEFCIFCSACEKVCPEKAIKVERKWISHTDVNAAAWLTALKKVTSVETVAKELRTKSVGKRVERVRNVKG